MRLFSYTKVYNIAKYQIPILTFSSFLLLGSIFLMFTKTPNYGIDFSGGTIAQVKYEGEAPIDKIRESLEGTIFADAQIQEFGSKSEIIIKTPSSSNALGQDVGDEINRFLDGTGDFEIRRIDMVGAKVGAELREAGVMAVVVSLIGVLIYITFRFEWQFAVAAVLSTMHDIILVVGFILLFNVPVNLDILAALLTVLGYSLNNTIVIFDRIREQLPKSKTNDFKIIMNEAISRTLSRTTITSFTTLFVVATTYLFGGELLKPLSLVLIVGITLGTFSSIFIASTLLNIFGFSVDGWRSKEAKKAIARAEKEKMRAMYEQGTV